MLEIKNTDREIKAAFDVLIMRPNMAEGRTDKLEERSIHNYKTKAKRKKNQSIWKLWHNFKFYHISLVYKIQNKGRTEQKKYLKL